MATETKIQKVGDSLGIILPQEALKQLQCKEGQTVFLSDGIEGTVRISQTPEEVSKDLELAEGLMDRYENTLRELAK